MNVEKFEDLIIWQKSRLLVGHIYNGFSTCKDYSFKDQICRAAVSIMNNIAEGFEKKSDNDFKKFLYISKGSCGEVRSMLYLAMDLTYMSKEKVAELSDISIQISKMISGFIRNMP